jgi:hypothetical protein
LILTGTFSYFGFDGWDDLERDPAELRARLVPELGDDYTPSTEQLARWQTWCRAAGSTWGSGEALKALLPSVRSIRQLAMVERMCASPGMARALEAVFRTDVRSILPTITAPTLVIHAREDLMPVQRGRYLADHIPGARLLEVDGNDHVPWLADPDKILTVVEEFLTGSHAAPSPSRRALRTVLFTDIVASTQRAAATGDERWRAVLHRFGELTAEPRNDSAARWSRAPATGISPPSTARRRPSAAPRRCVLTPRRWASKSALASTPASASCWTPTSGALQYTSRRASWARPAPVKSWFLATVRDLVVGSGTGFEDRGSVELRGVPGTWQLLAVDRHGPQAGSPEAELVSMPTPGRRTAMRRSDRAVEAIARRAPWILRGMAHLAPATGRR